MFFLEILEETLAEPEIGLLFLWNARFFAPFDEKAFPLPAARAVVFRVPVCENAIFIEGADEAEHRVFRVSQAGIGVFMGHEILREGEKVFSGRIHKIDGVLVIPVADRMEDFGQFPVRNDPAAIKVERHIDAAVFELFDQVVHAVDLFRVEFGGRAAVLPDDEVVVVVQPDRVVAGAGDRLRQQRGVLFGRNVADLTQVDAEEALLYAGQLLKLEVIPDDLQKAVFSGGTVVVQGLAEVENRALPDLRHVETDFPPVVSLPDHIRAGGGGQQRKERNDTPEPMFHRW